MLILLLLCSTSVFAEGEKGTLKIIGVPDLNVSGRYDPEEGSFFADVHEFQKALIQVELEGVTIQGQKMQWQTKNNHLVMSVGARLEKDDFEISALTIEYFGDEKRLEATGEVVVITEDTTLYANKLHYDETTDEAIFTGQVKVLFADGTLEGEKFVMFLEKNELHFFGSFQGEFSTENN